jgi:hypothetical protein
MDGRDLKMRESTDEELNEAYEDLKNQADV